MGELSRNIEIIQKLHRTDLTQLRNLSMLYDMCLAVKDEDLELAKAEMRTVKERASLLTRTEGSPAVELYWNVMLFLAQNRDLDSYLIYLERYREPEQRFYLPRRKQFMRLGITQALQELIDDKLDILTISCAPGVGKAQPLYSKVLTPSGFVRMGDIHVGDTVISGENRHSKVIGVFPQGKKPIYEVTFDDGSKCRCSDEHLWKVQTRNDRRCKPQKYRVVELKSMLHNLHTENGRRKNYSIDYVPQIRFSAKKLLLHPYVMGVLIGDGNLTNNSVRVSLPDEFRRFCNRK